VTLTLLEGKSASPKTADRQDGHVDHTHRVIPPGPSGHPHYADLKNIADPARNSVDPMPLDRFLQWGTKTRDRNFPGRVFVGVLYRILLYGIFDPLLWFFYRLRFALSGQGLQTFRQPRFRLLREIRSRCPRPILLRLWLRSHPDLCGASGWVGLQTAIHTLKKRTNTLPWLLPEETLLAHCLDCKGFAVLFSSLLTICGFNNELWIGLAGDGENGHAWVVIEDGGGRIAVDQMNGLGVPEAVYLKEHRFAMTISL